MATGIGSMSADPTAAAQLHWGEGGLLVRADKQNSGLPGFGHDRDRRDEGLGGALAGLEIHVGSHADQQCRCRFAEAQLHIERNDVVGFLCPGCDLVDRRLKALVGIGIHPHGCCLSDLDSPDVAFRNAGHDLATL